MTVFPEGMNRLDPQRVGESLAEVERYIRYMTERIEFAMNKGVQTAPDKPQGDMNALARRVTALEARDVAQDEK